MKFWKPLLLCSLLGTASLQAAACYTVYDAANQVVYHASTPPVDMSLPISQTLPRLYPGGHLVMGEGNNCPREQPVAQLIQRTPGTAPLLTDRRTAAAMKVPHTILASGAALIQPSAQPAQNTAPVALAAPVEVAAAKPRNGTVITELHNPPLMSVEHAGSVIITELR